MTHPNEQLPTRFDSLGLKPALLNNLESLGYKKMTAIQAKSLPYILKGGDVIGQGKTGSGKTAAFGLGVLNALDVRLFRVQSLILCPTRELADQVAKEVRRLARGVHNIKVLTLCGGMPFGPQIGSLEHGAHIVVGTPGRIEEHVRKNNLDLSHLKNLVLDEADRMLDMGFADALEHIINHAPSQRQTLLFSATFAPQVDAIAANMMNNPIKIEVQSTHEVSVIGQRFYQVEGDEQRMEALKILIFTLKAESLVVFCSTKKSTQEVANTLSEQGISALALHGDLEQKHRDITLTRFANKSIQVLVATDVAARGLDIDNLDAVINYHLPRETEVYVHRIGRTGRAGTKGIASSFFSQRERNKLDSIQALLNQEPTITPLPSLPKNAAEPYQPTMVTLQIGGGKKQKVRPGDIVGCLTSGGHIGANQLGKIAIYDNTAFVAVSRSIASIALQKVQNGKLKGRAFRVRKIT